MNYKQMLDKFCELEKRLQVAENQLQALQLRVAAMEKPQFQDTYKVPGEPPWPKEFWPTLWNITSKDSK